MNRFQVNKSNSSIWAILIHKQISEKLNKIHKYMKMMEFRNGKLSKKNNNEKFPLSLSTAKIFIIFSFTFIIIKSPYHLHGESRNIKRSQG